MLLRLSFQTNVCVHRYWQDPAVLSKLSQAMGPALGGVEGEEGEEIDEEEEEEDDDDGPIETVFDAASRGTILASQGC